MGNRGKNLYLIGSAIGSAIGFAIGLAGAEARANPQMSVSNPRSTLPGARASLLGGAFTALSDDATGSYYNPAGLSFITDDGLEVSATALRSTKTVYEKAVDDEPFDQRSQEIYPSFFGGTKRLGPLTIGYSFITLDARNVYQQNKYESISTDPRGLMDYSRTYQETSNYIWAGGSAALRLGKSLSLGMSVFYYQRKIEFSTNQLVTFNNGGIHSVNDTLKALNTGVAGVYGLVWRSDHWSVGASVKLATALSDQVTLLQDVVDYDPDSTSRDAQGDIWPTVTTTRSPYKPLYELNPPTYSFGAAVFPSTHLLLSADVLVHEGVKSPYRSAGGDDLHTTLNYSAGVELRFGPLGAYGGWFTNNSLYRAPDPSAEDQPVHVDFIGTTGGLGWAVGKLEGQAGLVRQVGRGEAQIHAGDPTIQTVDAEISTYVVSGKVPL